MEDDDVLSDLFPEPPRPPSPEPTFAVYKREQSKKQDWTDITIRLVGSHPLWGHHLWNAALAMATYLDERPHLYRGRNVLELGAGGALPSLVAAVNGAVHVVITDYHDQGLISNISFNASQNLPASILEKVHVQGYLWGRPIEPLLEPLSSEDKFHLVILSDLVFNHSQHDALLTTCEHSICAGKDALVLVFYTHHRPALAHRDMEFFSKAQERGWKCEEVVTRKFPPMFPDDPGAEEIRATVHGWRLTR